MKTLSPNGWKLLNAMNKLTGPNFLEWSSKIKIILVVERKADILDIPIPEKPSLLSPKEEWKAYEAHWNDLLLVSNVMLQTMAFPLFRECAGMTAPEIYKYLDDVYNSVNHERRYEIITLLSTKTMKEDDFVRPFLDEKMLLISEYGELGGIMSRVMKRDFLLNFLPTRFNEVKQQLINSQHIVCIATLYSKIVEAEKEMLRKGEFIPNGDKVHWTLSTKEGVKSFVRALNPDKELMKVWCVEREHRNYTCELERILHESVQELLDVDMESVDSNIDELDIKD